MNNKDVLTVTLVSLSGQCEYNLQRHKRTDIRLRIDFRNIRVISDYKHTTYDIIDADTGKLIAVQPAEDSMLTIDIEWLYKENEQIDDFIGL